MNDIYGTIDENNKHLCNFKSIVNTVRYFVCPFFFSFFLALLTSMTSESRSESWSSGSTAYLSLNLLSFLWNWQLLISWLVFSDLIFYIVHAHLESVFIVEVVQFKLESEGQCWQFGFIKALNFEHKKHLKALFNTRKEQTTRKYLFWNELKLLTIFRRANISVKFWWGRWEKIHRKTPFW